MPSLSKTKKAAAAKGIAQNVLPSRHALSEITKGDAVQRSLGNYAKFTPGIPSDAPNIFEPITLKGKRKRL